MSYPRLFMLLVGLLIVGQWIFFLVAGLVPELSTKPAEISTHIAAELTLALALLAGSLSMGRSPSRRPIPLLALGMLIYSVINSSGYFVERSEWGMVAMFGLLLIGAVVATAMVAMKPALPPTVSAPESAR